MLPSFRYHPDPLTTGCVAPSESSCVACGKTRAYIYAGPVYARDELPGKICPWCIADGSASEQFSATFTDGWALVKAGISPLVIAEVTMRTPGFSSWQAEQWLSHCMDACEFHGDLPSSKLKRLGDEVQAQLWPGTTRSPEDWKVFLRDYSPGGDPSIYWFRCRHCGKDRFAMDCS